MIFTYGKTKLKIPDGYEYVYYDTFIAGEWDFLKVKDTDTENSRITIVKSIK